MTPLFYYIITNFLFSIGLLHYISLAILEFALESRMFLNSENCMPVFQISGITGIYHHAKLFEINKKKNFKGCVWRQSACLEHLRTRMLFPAL